MFAAAVHGKAIELSKLVLRMTTASGSGHPSSALSLAHVVVALMYRLMRWDPRDPWNPAADRLVLSEGHAVPIVYAAYADLGGVVGHSPNEGRALTPADLDTLRAADSVLDGHPNPAEGFPFFDSATGSLGQGLSAAAGLALAARLRGWDRHVYAIIGDGESREGQIWEAADFIADHKLAAVTAIFNCNGQGQADYVSPQQSADTLARKMAAFGWEVLPVDGHDPDAVLHVLQAARTHERPAAVIARTQKGWGVPALADKSNHGKPLTSDTLPAAQQSLDATAVRIEAQPGAAFKDRPTAPQRASRTPAPPPCRVSFQEAMEKAGLGGAVAKNQLSTRRAFGAALLALGAADERVVSLDADVSNSTFAEMFARAYPQRFFECKIGEQNMVSAAVGLAAAGFVPFVSSFAKFLSRAYDQVEMAAITRANIKLVGSHSGVSLAADGPSQMSLPDVAFFRSFGGASGGNSPACASFHPADAVAAYRLTLLMAQHAGMCYMRTHRPDVAAVYSAETQFEVGGSHVVVEGDAVAVVSAGYMLHVCREVVNRLASRGVRCMLVDAYSLPLSAGPILQAGQQCGHRYLCVEDNFVGGVGSAVAEIVAAAGVGGQVEQMTVNRLPKSARQPDEVLRHVGLGAEAIERRIQALHC